MSGVPWLHTPIRTFEQVADLVRVHQDEGPHLDFKREFWPGAGTTKDELALSAAEEAAKDVVALMNAEGGSIVLGVNDTNDRASGFFPKYKFGKDKKTLLDRLSVRLSPEAAASTVTVHELAGEDEKGVRQEVLVVNVPPWPHGPVAARYADDRQSYRFPVRVDRDARFLSWEDAMVRFDAARRGTFLRLTALVQAGVRRVRIASPMEAIHRNEVVIRLLLPPGTHGSITMLDHDAATLVLDCDAQQALHGQSTQTGRSVGRHGSAFVTMGNNATGSREVRVPYDLIDSVWSRTIGTETVVEILLSATLTWGDGAWTVGR